MGTIEVTADKEQLVNNEKTTLNGLSELVLELNHYFGTRNYFSECLKYKIVS